MATFDEGDGSGPQLFAAGVFHQAGSVPARAIARWDGQAWSDVGGGLNDDGLALLTWDDGSGGALYVGGRFTSAGGAPASKLARWDGTTWSEVGGGLSGGAVDAMVVHDDGSGEALYVGGWFQFAGGTPMNRLARWNGTVWSSIGEPSARVRAMVVHEGDLFIGGNFKFISGQPRPAVAQWTGANWFSVGSIQTQVHALEVFDDGAGPRLFAGGDFWSPFGIQHLARFEPGVGWGGPSAPSPVGALEVYDDSTGPALYWVDSIGLRRWKGTTVETVDTTVGGGGALHVHDDGASPWPSLFAGTSVLTPPGAGFIASDRIARWTNTCPCTEAQAYCTAGTTSSGCVPSIAGAGFASRSRATGFDVTVSGAEGDKTGILFFGTSGAQANPWGNGTSTQCVVPPVQRTGLLSGGGNGGACDGVYALDFNAWMSANPTKAPAGGEQVHLQAWMRDPANTSNRTTSMSDGLRFAVCP